MTFLVLLVAFIVLLILAEGAVVFFCWAAGEALTGEPPAQARKEIDGLRLVHEAREE